MNSQNIENIKDSYDSIHYINICKVEGDDWVTIDGVGKDALIYIHDSDSGNGCGILGSLDAPKWIVVGERSEIFDKYILEIYDEFKIITGWSIEDRNFINELLEG